MTTYRRAITRTRIVLTILVVWATATIALAQSAGPPSFLVGDTWKRSNGLEVTVVKTDDNHVVMTGLLSACPACQVHFNNDFQIVEATEEREADRYLAGAGLCASGPELEVFRLAAHDS